MVRWNDVIDAVPDYAATAQRIFDAHRHKTLATLRADGSPRISGIEAEFRHGELVLGMMPGSRKARDLQRDPRFALHSASVDPDDANPSAWSGDAKLSGDAVEVTDPERVREMLGDQAEGGAHLFFGDIREIVVTRVGDPPDHLVIEVWRPDQGVRRFERR